jgi:hypothetical protein
MAATEVPDLIGDPAALADLQVGGVQPEIGPLAVERAFQEGTHALVYVLAELGDLGLRDAGQAHGLDQIVDAPGRDAGDPGFLDHGHQRLLGRPPRFEEGRKVAPLPELGDAQLQLAEPGVERALAIAVPVVGPLGGAFVAAGADHPLHVRLHQDLEHALGQRAEEVAVAGLLDQVGECHSVVGHPRSSRGRSPGRLW